MNGSHTQGRLEFMQSVGAGQTVTAAGGLYGDIPAIVQLDAPKAFHAAVTLDVGEVLLQGLHATSYTLAPGTLTLYNGGTAIDSLRLTVGSAVTAFNPPTYGFSVSQAGSVVDIFNGVAPTGVVLPIHG